MKNTSKEALTSQKTKRSIPFKISMAVTGLLLIAWVLFIWDAFCGNFISGMYFKSKVQKYIAETYPDKGYRVSDYRYNFKTGGYWFDIIDPDSEDGSFTAGYSESDKAVFDTYEKVINLTNTVERLEYGFRKEVDPIIEKHLQTMGRTENGKMVPGEFGYATCQVDDSFYDFDSDFDYLKDKIYLDMPLDAKNMPLPTKIYLSVRGNKEQSYKRALEIAKDIRSKGYRIDYYDFTTDESDGYNEIYYEMIPADVFFSAKSTDDFQDYMVNYYKDADDAPTTTHATFSTQPSQANKQ